MIVTEPSRIVPRLSKYRITSGGEFRISVFIE